MISVRTREGSTTEAVRAFAAKRVLLLQGPLGPFFARLARDLRVAGATVHKINFNGGDWLFYPRRAITFRGTLTSWPAYFERFIAEQRIEAVYLFGDCRPLHRVVIEVAENRGVDVFVFEEGYVRPDYITLERHGVNGRSRIPRSQVFYRNVDIEEAPRTIAVGNTFRHAALWATLYYLASVLLRRVFEHYQHHRPLNAREALPWLRALFRKGYYSVRERQVLAELTGRLSKRFYLVPLQVHTDAQVQVHSTFASVASFFDEVMTSFAASAPKDTVLVIKHHPLDRGYHDYERTIRRLGSARGVGHRVLYIHDQHLPTLLEHARGVVLINSTVGLSAIHHRVPVKTRGNAIYDMPGLTYPGPLDEFWAAAESLVVDTDLYSRFRSHVINSTQINGNFYRRLAVPGSAAGLAWPNRTVAAQTTEEASTTARDDDLPDSSALDPFAAATGFTTERAVSAQ